MSEEQTIAPEPAAGGVLSKLRQSRLVPALVSGVVSGTLVVSFDISLAALIFVGGLSSRLSMGIGIFLIGSIIVGLVVSLGSSFKPVIAAPQTDASVIMALMAAAIVQQIQNVDAFPTVVVAIGLTSLVTGAFFLLLGVRRLGILVRFVPYPVVGGFLAGAGWLLLHGTVVMLVGIPITLSNASLLLDPGLAAKYVPGLLFGAFLCLILRRFRNYLLLPALLTLAIVVFYAILRVTGMSVDQALDSGWLLGRLPAGSPWPPMGLDDFRIVQWPVLLKNAGDIAAVVAMASITLLLSASSVEVATEQEIDLDRELKWTGVGNMFAGLVGGMVGYMSLAESTMNYKSGANTRLTGVVSALCCVVVTLLGTGMLSYIPLPVLGGLLSYLGFDFLIDTLYEDWFRLRRLEYAVIVLITVVIGVQGFLTGVLLGGIVSMFLFAASYSRIEVIRNEISGAHLRSNVGRNHSEESTLEETGRQIHILQLQGYIFFGTAFRLLTRAQERILNAHPVPLRYLVLDFRHVNGLDSSAVASFRRLRQLAENNDVRIVLTEVPNDVRTLLERSRLVRDDDEVCRIFPDIDHGLELCENELITSSPRGGQSQSDLSRDLWAVFSGAGDVSRFLGYLERVETPADYDLFRQGDASKDLYIIESGELTAWLEIDGKKVKRLRTMGPGSVVGESGLYMDATRSATVTANSPTILYRLSVDALQRLTQEAPELAAAFHRLVARLLAQRIVNTTNPVKSLFN